MAKGEFSKKIVDWYLENHRDLPWRRTKDPYRIWLSEVILQQTRVAQGLPYYEAFVRNFPTVRDLANASQEQVLRIWQGLGYYSRARNLHKCAKEIVNQYNGKFPRSYRELLALPGIGSYTAAAVASMAFDESVVVVDGNVFRVLSRIYGIREDISLAKSRKVFETKGLELVDMDRPGYFNQAMMEFGALHCTPKNPACHSCIFSSHCYANVNSLQALLPVNGKKIKVKTRHFNYLVIHSAGKVGMRRRNEKDIWNGLYDFHLIEGRKSLNALLKSELKTLVAGSNFKILPLGGQYKHVLTHQKIQTRFISLATTNAKHFQRLLKKLGLRSFSKRQVDKLPKPVLITRFLDENPFLD